MGVCTLVCTKERKGVAAEVLMATPCTNSLGGESGGSAGGTSMKDVGSAVLAGSSPPFLGRERAAVDVDVGPESDTQGPVGFRDATSEGLSSVLLKRKKAEIEAQRGKPKGKLESESRNAIL